MRQHVNYINTLALFLRRFGTAAQAFDHSRSVWLESNRVREIYAHAVEMAAFAKHWRGGGYITEARPCYIEFGKQYAVAVTMECSIPDLLPSVTMYWLVSEPPEL